MTRARLIGFGLGLAIAVGGSLGCRSEQSHSRDAAYRVELAGLESRAAGSRAHDRGWERQTLEDALEGTSMFSLYRGSEVSGEPLDVQAEVLEVRTSRGLILRLRLAMDVPPDLAGVLDDLEAVVEVERAGGDSAVREDLPMAAERAAAVLDAKVLLARTPMAADSLLRDRDPELVLIALDWVQEQRDRNAAETVASLLRHPDTKVALRAVEVLGEVGGARQVPNLISAARLSDRDHTGRLYEALATLGGPEAEGFLAFAARNEDDPALARLAERALDEAKRAAPRSEPTAVSIPRGHR